MIRAVHANCFVSPEPKGDMLLTDEPLVTDASSLKTRIPEGAVDPAVAHAASVAAWRLARTWFLRGELDDTVVGGISAGDLAGLEAAISVLIPAARGALAMAALIDSGTAPSCLISVRPIHTPDGARYDRLETIAAEAAIAAARQRLGADLAARRVVSTDPRNATLRAKYARTRDAEFLLGAKAVRTARELAYAVADRIAGLRRHGEPSWVVVEYNPTRAFSAGYRDEPGRRRLVRWLADPRELPDAVWAGDLPQGPIAELPRSRSSGVGAQLRDHLHELAGTGFTVADVPLWPVVAPALIALAERYGRFARHAGPRTRAQLRRFGVEAALVPYDNDPSVRLLVRSAQSLGIPTLSINDGFKSDEIQIEGLSTDRALAWSQTIAERYFVRHPGGAVVTGNPRFGGPGVVRHAAATGARRVIVGSFTFSGVDLNCRREDPERFLDQVMSGIAAALPEVSPKVVLKLHPADEPAPYAEVLARHPTLDVEIVSSGDVMDMLHRGDVYVTTYSTSLLEAAVTMPVVYYRVNQQRVGLPFDDDPWLARRTADTPQTLAALLADCAILSEGPPAGWTEAHLGPSGATERIARAIETEVRRRDSRADAAHRAPDAARRR